MTKKQKGVEGEIVDNNLKSLDERDKVRRKIETWLGSSNHNAVMHCIKELAGNSMDEIHKGKGDSIRIEIKEDRKTIEYLDNAHGLPVEGINPEDNRPNYKLLTEVLFAGSKYENGLENSDYTVGTNGVFLTVLTYTCEHVSYEVARPNGNVYAFAYEKGIMTEEFREIGKSDTTYTKIVFTLDDDIYDDNYFTFDEIKYVAKQQASLGNVNITVVDKASGIEESFIYTNGIVELLEEYNAGKNSLNSEIIYFKDKADFFVKKLNALDNMLVEVAIQFCKEDSEKNINIEFLNGSHLIHHGTIYDGFINGLRAEFNKFIKDNNMYNKTEKQITKDDVLVGLNYIVNFKSYFPKYSNQTKFATDVEYFKPIIQQLVEKHFEIFAIENKDVMTKLANQILINKRSREKAESTRLDVRKKLEGGLSLGEKPSDFDDCRIHDSSISELYIVEGKSAKGQAKNARNALFQAIQAVRGKSLNCLKAKDEKIFNNKEILALLKIIGCGVEYKSKYAKNLPQFDVEKCPWKRIIILTDADKDGLQIRTLVGAFILVLLPSLFDHGKVCVATSPLYYIYEADKHGRKNEDKDPLYAYSDEEKDKIIKKMKGNYKVERSKGLGEDDAKTLRQTVMNPETRNLYQIQPTEEMVKMFNILLGDELQARKDYIELHGSKYIDVNSLEGGE